MHFVTIGYNLFMLGICKVPVITPLFVYWPNQLGNKEAYDSCCEVTLLCYKPGTRPGNLLWKNLEDETAGKFDDKHEAMLDFVNDPQSKCPKFIRADFLNALKRRDNLLLQALHEMERDADENHDSIEDEEDQGVDMFADLLDGGEHDYQIDDNDSIRKANDQPLETVNVFQTELSSSENIIQHSSKTGTVRYHEVTFD